MASLVTGAFCAVFLTKGRFVCSPGRGQLDYTLTFSSQKKKGPRSSRFVIGKQTDRRGFRPWPGSPLTSAAQHTLVEAE